MQSCDAVSQDALKGAAVQFSEDLSANVKSFQPPEGAPKWCSSLRHCISVLEAALQTPWFKSRLYHNHDWESHTVAHNWPSVVQVWLV